MTTHHPTYPEPQTAESALVHHQTRARQPQRAELEKRLLDIQAQMAALTPDGFKMPETMAAKVSDRLKNKELVIPDTEVLRQLLLEKARIAEQLQDLPQRADELNAHKIGFSVKANGPTRR